MLLLSPTSSSTTGKDVRCMVLLDPGVDAAEAAALVDIETFVGELWGNAGRKARGKFMFCEFVIVGVGS